MDYGMYANLPLPEARDLINTALASSKDGIAQKLKDIDVKLEAEKLVAKAANEQGDRSENAEWQIAQNNIARLTANKVDLINKEAAFKLFTGKYVQSDLISIGSTVKIAEEVVTTNEQTIRVVKLVPKGLGDMEICALSINTPIGSSLVGRKQGDEFSVNAPVGHINIKVLEVI